MNGTLLLFFLIFSLVLCLVVCCCFCKKEGFQNWNDDVVQDFKNYENTANPKFLYDVDYVSLTASQDDVRSLVDNNKWTWDPAFHKIWANSSQGSPITKYEPVSNADTNQTIYNQGAAQQILALNTDEGRFLTHGVLLDRNDKGGMGLGSFGKNSGLDPGNKDILRCDPTKGSMVRVRRGGFDGLFSNSPDVSTDVPYSYLPYLIPGFSFLGKPCNPCVALNSPPDYSCPFTIRDSVSPIWQYLYRIPLKKV
jgi:hypothetical protein